MNNDRGRRPKELYPMTVGGVPMWGKQCTKCEEIKPLNKFVKLWRSSDGHAPICKRCKSEENAKRCRSKY